MASETKEGGRTVGLAAPAPGAQSAPHDYKTMLAGDMLGAVGDDASKWADAFCQINPGLVPHEIMLGWFANAIEHSGDVRRGRFIQDDEAWLDFQDDVFWQRRFWRELSNLPADGAGNGTASTTEANQASGRTQ